MSEPTDPSIGEAVERVKAFAAVMVPTFVGSHRLDDDLLALLSENARLRERVGVLEGVLTEIIQQAEESPCGSADPFIVAILDLSRGALARAPKRAISQTCGGA